MLILGAGLSGCIAGAMNQNSKIIEKSNGETTHKAVLRFRSPKIGEAIGIPFEKVKVYKGIWHNDRPVELSPRYINLYSRKVSDSISARSICNLEPVERWIAPDNLHEVLRDQVHNQIEYNSEFSLEAKSLDPIVSTLPMPVAEKIFCIESGIEFNRSTKSIIVNRYKIPDCNAFMTYYYTDPVTGPYRASIERDILIIESMWPISDSDVKTVTRSFGLTGIELQPIVIGHKQNNGKISKVDELKRRAFIAKLTLIHGVYSLGRFATWRNLVLDDVYKDIMVIKRLMNTDTYNHRMYQTGE